MLPTTALVDYNRLQAQVAGVPQGHFDLPLLRRLLRGFGAKTVSFHVAGVADEDVLVESSRRLGFFRVPLSRSEDSFLQSALKSELARARRFEPRRLVLVGAEDSEQELILCLREVGAFVTVLHWPDALSPGITGAANRCFALDDWVLIVEPEELIKSRFERGCTVEKVPCDLNRMLIPLETGALMKSL